MPSLHVSLPDDLKAFVDEQGASPLYAGSSDFLRHVLREEQRRIAERQRINVLEARFTAEVRAGFESPDSGLTPDQARAKAMARIADLYG